MSLEHGASVVKYGRRLHIQLFPETGKHKFLQYSLTEIGMGKATMFLTAHVCFIITITFMHNTTFYL